MKEINYSIKFYSTEILPESLNLTITFIFILRACNQLKEANIPIYEKKWEYYPNTQSRNTPEMKNMYESDENSVNSEVIDQIKNALGISHFYLIFRIYNID